MIKGVQDIYYNVSDMRRSIAFYTEALQMKLKFEDDGWTSLDCGGVQVGLHPTEPGEEIVRYNNKSTPTSPASLNQNEVTCNRCTGSYFKCHRM